MTYTPTRCQDKKLAYLRWIRRHLLKQLGQREPEGRPEYQLLGHTPRLGCGSPMPGEIADYYKTQNTGQDHISPRPPSDSPANTTADETTSNTMVLLINSLPP